MNSDNIPIAPVIKFDNIHVWVKCPFCSRIHIHGSCGGKDFEGHRTPHCMYYGENYSQQYYVKIVKEESDSQ